MRARVGARWGHAAGVALASGAVACAGILGIDDRSLDTQGADDGSVETGPAEGGAPDGPVADAPAGSDAAHVDARRDGGAGDASTGDAPAVDAVVPDASGDADAAADAVVPDASGDADAAADAPVCPDPCPLATGLNHPWLMAADANNVYWTELGDDLGSGNGSVKACPVSGCGASGPLVLAAGLTNPRGIAVDGQTVYFGTATYGGVVGGIWACALAGCGGSPTRLASAGIPYGVAVDGAYVYWVDWDDGTVHKAPKGGGADDLLYDAASGAIVEPGSCVVDGPFLYVMDVNADALRLPTSGGEPTLLGTSAISGQFGITTDSTSVYFGGQGEIFRAGKNAADSGAPIANTVADPIGLAFDPASGMIYWANWGSGSGNDGTVGKLAPDGGGLRVLAASQATPYAVALSGNFVFWLSYAALGDGGVLEPSTGALWRTAK